MGSSRVDTTADGDLLARARELRGDAADGALVDEGLAMLVRHRERRPTDAEIDAAYAAYDEHPLDEPDEWGDLESFLEAARKT